MNKIRRNPTKDKSGFSLNIEVVIQCNSQSSIDIRMRVNPSLHGFVTENLGIYNLRHLDFVQEFLVHVHL